MYSNLNILGVDTETGGLKPGTHSLLQVGLVAFKNGRVADRLKIYVRQDEYVVTPMAMEINQLSLKEVYNNGLLPNKVVEKIIEFVDKNFETSLPILLGHNVGFDKRVLKHLFESQGVDMDRYISHRMIDTMSILWILYDLGLVPEEACSSSGAFEYFGIYRDKAHDALDDIVATLELYSKLKEIIASQNLPF